MDEGSQEDERDSAFGPMAKLELSLVALVLIYALASGGIGNKPAQAEIQQPSPSEEPLLQP